MSEPRSSTTVAYRARFDECGPDGGLRTSVLLRWAQDAAWIHSERLGFGRKWYADRGLAWVVRGLELTVFEPVTTGSTLSATTRVVGFRRVLARRVTEVVLADGRPAARCTTDWAMIDVERGAPTRVPADFPALFDSPPGGFEPLRVGPAAAPADAATSSLRPRPHELDPMAHANNAAYVDWLEEGIGAAGGAAAIAQRPRTYRLEYVIPVAPDDDLAATAWPTGATSWRYELARLSPDGIRAAVLRATLEAG